jgi:hypothetical protein
MCLYCCSVKNFVLEGFWFQTLTMFFFFGFIKSLTQMINTFPKLKKNEK